MPVGFGHGPFGHFPFGGVHWARRVTVDAVPTSYIEDDNDPELDPQQPLQKLLEVFQEVAEPIRRKIDRLLDLRDPTRIPFVFTPGTFLDFRVGDVVLTKAMSLSGRATFAQGSAQVVGQGTKFTSELYRGALVRAAGAAVSVRVLDVLDDTHATLSSGYVGNSAQLVEVAREQDRGTVLFVRPYTAGPIPDGEDLPDPQALTTRDTRIVVALQVPDRVTPGPSDYIILDSTQLDWLPVLGIRDLTAATALGAELGVEVDEADEEAISRSAMANAPQFLPLRGAAKGYQVLGRIYGYDVTVKPLWAYDTGLYSTLDLAQVGDVFEIVVAGQSVWVASVPPGTAPGVAPDEESLDYVKTHRLLVVIEALSRGQGAGAGVDRIVQRLVQVKPHHVDLIRVAFRRTFDVDFRMKIEAFTVESGETTVPFGYDFDRVAADETGVDRAPAVGRDGDGNQ